MNIFLFLSLLFLLTFGVGKLLEKIRVPWIFAALILGSVIAIYNPFTAITGSDTFEFLAKAGMYFLLFMIGLEVDLKKLKKQKSFIFKATFFILLLEAVFGSLLLHFVFGYAWGISALVALSFATVGEAILVPILEEFKITKTKLGQTLISIGTIDDIIEIGVLIAVITLIGGAAQTEFQAGNIVLSLFSLFVLALALIKFGKGKRYFNFLNIKSLFLLTIFILFLFVGIGNYAEAGALGAILAGISLRSFIPHKELSKIEKEVKAVSYGLFAPIFFFWVGASLDMEYLITYPLLILLVVLVTKSAKIIGSYIVGRNYLGTKKSILLGIGLSVRFSTSIIIITILFENGIIDSKLYSIIIASSIVFKFLVPVLFSNLLVKWEKPKKMRLMPR